MSAAIRKKELTLLCLVLAALAALFLRPSIRGNDGVGNYAFLAAMLRGGNLDLRDVYQTYDSLKQYPYQRFADLPVSSATGRPGDRYGIGSALLWSPFALAVHGVRLVSDPVRADAVSRPYEWAVGVGTAFWGSLALGLLYLRLRRSWPPLACAAALTGLLLATPLGFYLYAHGSMSHGASFFAVTGALLATERVWRRPSARGMAWCGGWCALLLMTRFQDATWVLLIGGALAWRLWRGRQSFASTDSPGSSAPQAHLAVVPEQGLKPGREAALKRAPGPIQPSTRLLKQGAIMSMLKHADKDGRITATNYVLLSFLGCFGLAFLLCFLPQMAVWKYLYGSWLSGPAPYLRAGGGAGEFSFWPRHWAGVLASERGGVLAWHPVYLLGLIGLAQLARRDGCWRLTAILGLAGFAFQFWLVSCWSVWWGGASFGNRFFISALPFLAPGIAWWFGREQSRARRVAAYTGLALLIVWNMGLLYQYGTEMFPREQPVPWSRVIRQNVVAVPVDLWHRLAKERTVARKNKSTSMY